MSTGKARVYIVSSDGEVLDEFGDCIVQTGFYHTGLWATWSSDSRYVYYQNGDMTGPKICRYDTYDKTEIITDGDMEGAPPFDEPIISGYMGMLYAAGYGTGIYSPQNAPVPFESRDEHGLFMFDVKSGNKSLALSINQILDMHPKKDEILQMEKEYITKTGNSGFTLMAYCVRWNKKGDRCLFYFGNHCVSKNREEPKLCYVFTADRDFKNIHLALDFSFGKMNGVHWSWHPDGVQLIGYATADENSKKLSVCTVKYDGTEFKKISDHSSGGHVSVCPTDYNLLLTDEPSNPGRIVFIDIPSDEETGSYILPRVNGEKEFAERSFLKVCHHPVFSPDGKKVIVNTLSGEKAVLCEVDTIFKV